MELDEILGYHFGQACRYRAELGLPIEERIAANARERLAAAAFRARARGDERAAVNLLERAAALEPAGRYALAVELELCEAYLWSGRLADALDRARSLAQRAAAAGDRIGELCGRLRTLTYEGNIGTEGRTEELAALLDEAVPEFEAASHDLALYAAAQAATEIANMRVLMDQGLEAVERSQAYARRAGMLEVSRDWDTSFRFLGSIPLDRFVVWLDERNAISPKQLAYKARALAGLGRFDEARQLLAEATAKLADQGARMRLAGTLSLDAVAIELLAGDPAAAVEYGEQGCRLFEESGERGFLSTSAGMLAQAYEALERLREAEEWAERARDLGTSDDVITQALWRQVKAKVCAARGAHDEGERLAREAVSILDASEMLEGQASAYADLGEVLRRGEKDPTPALEEALARYERKGNLVMAARMRERLVEVPP